MYRGGYSLNVSLEQLRKRIDFLDKAFFAIFLQRLAIIPLVTEFKKIHHIPVFQQGREQQIYSNIERFAHSMGLPQEVLRELFQVVIRQSKSMEHDLMTKNAYSMDELTADLKDEQLSQLYEEGLSIISSFNDWMDAFTDALGKNEEKRKPYDFLVSLTFNHLLEEN